MRKAPRSPEPAKRWVTFLSNHREAIAAMDFFTVPTVTFGVLYYFFIITHHRRCALHCNVIRHPNRAWACSSYRKYIPGTYRDSDYGRPIHFYKTISAVDILTFVSMLQTTKMTGFVPAHTPESRVLAERYIDLQKLKIV